jgi:hypothetical protein
MGISFNARRLDAGQLKETKMLRSTRRASAIQVSAAVTLAVLTGISAKASVPGTTADNTNSASTFGPPVVATVTHGSGYGGTASVVTGTTGSGGSDAGGNTGDQLLAGANNGANGGGTASVSQAWRTRLTSEAGSLASNVLNLTGLETTGNSTDPYVLQMSFNPALVQNLVTLVQNKGIFLASPNGSGAYVNTVSLNTGNVVTSPLDNRYGYFGSYAAFQADPLGGNGGTPASEMGAWGVDTNFDQVWAAVNHNSTFAITVPSTPEPGTGALCAAGIAMLLRRRRA